MDELAFEAVAHHNEGLQLSGENLAVEIEPLNFRPPRVELPDGRLRVLPLGQVVQLAECLVELTFFPALSAPFRRHLAAALIRLLYDFTVIPITLSPMR